MRGKIGGVLCALAWVGVVAAGAGPAGAATDDRIPVIGASTEAVDACAASFPADVFAKVASEADVAAGQPVAVDVTWRPAWYSGDTVDVLGCVAANGRFVDGSVERGVDSSTGLWVHKFAVPADAAKDVVVCQAAVVFSAGDGDAKATRSDPDCFTVTAAAAPASPAPAATPSTGAGRDTTAAPSPAPAAAAPASTPATVAPDTARQKTPASAPRTAAAVSAPKPATGTAAVPNTQLPHTGAAERLLVAVAGILLAVGGWALGFGAGRRRTTLDAVRSALH